MLYSIHGLQQIYGDRTVLDIAELDIEPGKIYTLTGPNGAGKTTLLDTLAFLGRPTAGAITFNSEKVDFQDKMLRRLRRRVVLVDQHPILFTGPVWKNIEFGLKIRKIAKVERDSIINEVLQKVGMQHFANADAHKLSGGETKRVALARALAVKPEVLLCDEPTANVDTENQEIILKIMERSNSERNLSLIFATHYLSQAQRLADKTIVLENGKLSGRAGENVFDAMQTTNSTGKPVWQIDPQHQLSIDSGAADSNAQKVKLVIDPAKIQLVTEDSVGDKLWRGIISKIEGENGQVRITVDTGIILDVVLTKEDHRRKPYHVEQHVVLQIPSQSLKIFPRE